MNTANHCISLYDIDDTIVFALSLQSLFFFQADEHLQWDFAV